MSLDTTIRNLSQAANTIARPVKVSTDNLLDTIEMPENDDVLVYFHGGGCGLFSRESLNRAEQLSLQLRSKWH